MEKTHKKRERRRDGQDYNTVKTKGVESVRNEKKEERKAGEKRGSCINHKYVNTCPISTGNVSK